jgi:DNA-binding GntR family transcriptional regulator
MPMLVRLIMDYRDRARLIGLRARLGSDEIIEAAREHIALVDAAVARDEAALSRIIANHLEMTRKRSLEGL